jgi:hypothetical protein
MPVHLILKILLWVVNPLYRRLPDIRSDSALRIPAMREVAGRPIVMELYRLVQFCGRVPLFGIGTIRYEIILIRGVCA